MNHYYRTCSLGFVVFYDIRAWAHLSLYFSHKLKGGTALQQFRLSGDTGKHAESIQHLESALKEWEQVVVMTSRYFDDTSLTHLNKKYVNSGNSRPLARFSWANLVGEVKNDIEIARNARPTIPLPPNSLERR